MRKLEEFVTEKLKVTNKVVSIYTTLRKFIAWIEEEDEFLISRVHIEIRNYISSDKSMSKRKITNFLYKHIDDTIYVNEEEKLARNESNAAIYNYSFDIEGITFSINVKIYNDNELLSRSKDYILEKLKVWNNNTDTLKVELYNFVKWYMYDNGQWDVSDLNVVKFAEETTNNYFNGSYKLLYDFINKHRKDIIYVYEKKLNEPKRYMYSFDIDGIPFNLQAYIEDDSELLSKQWRILVEKLKVTKDSIRGNIKSTMKEFFLWYWGAKTINDDFWEAMSTAEFENDVIKDNFNNMNEFLDWFEIHMDDIVYFDETKEAREIYLYNFYCDGMEFNIRAYIIPEAGEIPFSKY